MRFRRSAAALGLLASALLAACSQPKPVPLQHLAPEAPAAAGLLPVRPPDHPSPLKERPPFGLYAQAPTDDTLTSLASGTLSPDGRFRAVYSPQGLWVARIDAAWLWQVRLPAAEAAPEEPKSPSLGAKAPAAPPPPKEPPRAVPPVSWSPVGMLLLQDQYGLWYQADPITARAIALAGVFRGKEGLELAATGDRVLYYQPGKTGRQLWTAGLDGSGAKLVGERLIGSWDAGGNLVTRQVRPAPEPQAYPVMES